MSQPEEVDTIAQPSEARAGASNASSKKPWVEKCRQWVDEQQEVAEPPPLVPDDVDDEPMDEPAELPVGTDLPLRQMLKDYSEKEILNSVMYECEWLKCGFETTEDLKYRTHVEAHIYQYLTEQRDSEDLVCFWDLCEFRTSDPIDLESHVLFHVYHNRVKTHGASLSAIIRIPKCNGDSRRRNCIDSFKTKFRCEWADCGENFTKVHLFFMHVNSHVQDQFPVDRKSTKEVLQCQWDGCKQLYKRRSIALEHMRRHSTERTIGCYTCGAIFVSRLKYTDHCKRQVEYHSREFPCPDCEKLFATKQLMIDHRNIHDKKYACPQCPMKWPSKKALATHIRYRHVNVKPFKCHICNHRTVAKQELKQHLVIHDPNRVLLVCSKPGCNASYKCARALRNHLSKIHGPRPIYSCHWCYRNYTEGAVLSRHLVNVHKCRRKLGQIRFAYRVDETDGCYRLDAFLDNDYAGVPAVEGQKQKRIKSGAAKKKKKTEPSDAWIKHSIASYRQVNNQVVIDMVPYEVVHGS